MEISVASRLPLVTVCDTFSYTNVVVKSCSFHTIPLLILAFLNTECLMPKRPGINKIFYMYDLDSAGYFKN